VESSWDSSPILRSGVLNRTARREAPVGVVFYLGNRRATSSFRAATDWSHDVSVRISRLRGLPAEQAFKEIDYRSSTGWFVGGVSHS
jgi:hypothetical protein